ncbi:hypothetical protein [Brevibacillus brevis]|uniref:hypothetical protein n=1 Tax=Brevibacillus brevis TaxID=1393 RepID=UPI0007D8C0B3|nr:hypothetical protein [Brevibacillus brevis]
MKTRKDILRPIRKLVRSTCASFSPDSNGHSNCCYLSSNTIPQCVFYRDDGQYPEQLKAGKVRCQYFETHVLPVDPAMELAYWGKHPDGEQGQAIGRCANCGNSFTKRSNRQEFCLNCREQQTRKVNRERQRKKYWEDKDKFLTI